MTALLYFATAAAAVTIAHRWLTQLSWRARIALVLFPLCFTGRALLTGRVHAPIELPYGTEPLHSMAPGLRAPRGHNGSLSDVYCLNIPWRSALRTAYRSGEWALWNPYSFCGDILAAGAQATPYEPMTLLSLLLPPAQSLTFLAAITFFLAALTMFLFLRDLGCTEAASLIGAAAWAYCSFLAYWLEWVIAPSTLWFPLVLLGVRRIMRDQSLRGAAILTTAWVMMLLNGHPESGLHIVFLGLIWSAGELLLVRGRGFVRATGLAVAAGVVSLALCAIFLMPILEALPQTQEYQFRRCCYATARKSVSFEAAFAHLEVAFIPFRFGDSSAGSGGFSESAPFSYLDSAYCGSLAFALALYGLWRSRRKEKWIATVLLVIGVLVGHEFAPFIDWLAKLPLFDIAINGRLVFAASFAIAVLAALGVDAAEGRKLQFVAAAVAVVLTVAVAVEWKPMLEWKLDRSFILERTLALIVPLVVVAVVPRKFTVASILLMLLAQRTVEAAAFYPTNDAEIFYPPIPILERLRKTPQTYRITGLGRVFTPNTATLYRVEDVRGYSAMTFGRLHDTYPMWSIEQPVWYNRVDDLTSPFLCALNVRFALARGGTPVPDGWRKVDRQPGIEVFENMRVLPRAFIPRRVVINGDVDAMRQETDFADRAWIEGAAGPPREVENGSGRVEIFRDRLSSYNIGVFMDRDGWIVISESAWKGWRATIDGRPTPVYFADHALIGLRVPAGAHHIYLRYLPHSFVVGRAISAATMALLIIFAFIARRESSRRSAHRKNADVLDRS